MFYAHFVLAKKGPLARIWLAAHWDKKLTKAHVFETNIEKSVDGILQPKVKMALRTSGHLLLGVVRIYSRKAKYLLQDCNEAFVKIKMAFRPGMVDLPEESREAAVNAITLPEVFHDFDTAMPELNDVDIEQQFTLNQSRAEEITLREDYGTMSLSTLDDGFGDMGFGSTSPDIMRGGLDVPAIDQGTLLFTEDGLEPQISQMSEVPEPPSLPTPAEPEMASPEMELGMSTRIPELGEVMAGGLFEGELFGEPSITDIPPPPVERAAPEEEAVKSAPDVPEISAGAESEVDDFDRFDGPPSPDGHLSDMDSRPASVAPLVEPEAAPLEEPVKEVETEIPAMSPPPPAEEIIQPPPSVAPMEQTLLLQNEEESFALAPVDATAIKGYIKTKRKRKLIVDEVKNISGEEMKNQLSDTSDIITTLDLAPPTRRLMHWKETGGVEKLFALPARPIPSRVLFAIYQRHLTSRSLGIEDFGMLGDAEKLGIDQQRDANVSIAAPPSEDGDVSIAKRLSRKRKHQTYEEPPSPAPVVHQRPPSVQPPIFDETVQSEIEAAPAPPEMSSLMEEEPPAKRHSPEQEVQMEQAQLEQSEIEQAPIEPPQIEPAHLESIQEAEPVQIEQPATPAPVITEPMTPLAAVPEIIASTPVPIETPIATMTSDFNSTLGSTAHFIQPETPTGLVQMPHADLLTPQEMSTSHITGRITMLEPPTPSSYPQIPSIPPPSSVTPFAGMDQRLDQISAAATERYLAQAMDTGIPHLPVDQVQQVLEEAFDQGDRAAPEDFALAASPGEFDEEQQTDETAEEFEERLLNKRAAQLFYLVKNRFNRTDAPFKFSEMTYRNHKKQAAQKFYSCLVLKKIQVLELDQEEPYDEIYISKGDKYENGAI